MEADSRSAAPPLTARERQVASLVGLGLTNRQIGDRLSISERTVGAHVQNILNKLGANNRAQIATWSAQRPDDPKSPNGASPAVARPDATARTARPTAPAMRRSRGRVLAIMAVGLASLLTRSDNVVSTSQAGTRVPAHGGLAYQAQLDGSGAGFSIRYSLGDPEGSAIRFVQGAVEYSVLKPGGNTGNALAMPPLPGYFAEVELSVKPGSDVTFWVVFRTGDGSSQVGQHLVYISTQAQAMQLAYFVGGDHIEYLGPQIPIQGLQAGRNFVVSALVNPPQYQVYLDGTSVINVRHEPSPPRQVPSFAIFGNGTGMVRISTIRVFGLSHTITAPASLGLANSELQREPRLAFE